MTCKDLKCRVPIHKHEELRKSADYLKGHGDGYAIGTVDGRRDGVHVADDLAKALEDADQTICRLCKVVNPQHENCISCEERVDRLRTLAAYRKGAKP